MMVSTNNRDFNPLRYSDVMHAISRSYAVTLAPLRPLDHAVAHERQVLIWYTQIYIHSDCEHPTLKAYIEWNLYNDFPQWSSSSEGAPTWFANVHDGYVWTIGCPTPRQSRTVTPKLISWSGSNQCVVLSSSNCWHPECLSSYPDQWRRKIHDSTVDLPWSVPMLCHGFSIVKQASHIP
jgi:hypothetical protein